MKYLYALLIFAIGETVGFIIFFRVRKILSPTPDERPFDISTVKGALERAVLFTGLLYNFPQILIAFGALKVATRLHDETKQKISNDYFLTGNLISILIAMLDAIIVKEWFFH